MPKIRPTSPSLDGDQSRAGDIDDQDVAATTLPDATARDGDAMPAQTDDGDADHPAAEAAAPTADGVPRRVLKLVLTLRPDEGAGYSALLALGADGCDPLFRCAVVPTLEAALNGVAALVVEAEERWQHQPRNSGLAIPQITVKTAPVPSDDAEQTTTVTEAVPSVEPSEAEEPITSQLTAANTPATTKRGAASQLSLFS